jgi:hypothetical protein
MTPPVPEPQTRTAYRDPRLTLDISSVAIAAHLVLAGHPLLRVVLRRGQALFVFSDDAQAALDRLQHAANELEAHRERAVRLQRARQEARS